MNPSPNTFLGKKMKDPAYRKLVREEERILDRSLKKTKAEAEKQVRDWKADFRATRKELAPIVKAYEKWLQKHIGKRCKDFATGCCVCHAWSGYDILEGLL